MDAQTAGVDGTRFYTQKFALASNTPAGMYTAKIATSVAGKSQNLPEDTITFEVTGKQAKGSSVLVYTSGTGAKTDVKLQSIYDPQAKTGGVIARFTTDFAPKLSQEYKIIAEKVSVHGKSGTIGCTATQVRMGPTKTPPSR